MYWREKRNRSKGEIPVGHIAAQPFLTQLLAVGEVVEIIMWRKGLLAWKVPTAPREVINGVN
jgi:hypothetical protein